MINKSPVVAMHDCDRFRDRYTRGVRHVLALSWPVCTTFSLEMSLKCMSSGAIYHRVAPFDAREQTIKVLIKLLALDAHPSTLTPCP
jgi:hypothetical protein